MDDIVSKASAEMEQTSDQFISEEHTPRDEDIPVSTIKFGDLFATRSDYSKGVFYRGQKKFLTSRLLTDTLLPDPNYNALEPPEIFMTRAQTRKHKKISNLGLLKTLDFKVVNNDVDEKAKKAALIRKQEDKIKQKRNKPPSTIILEKYSSYSKKDWKEVLQAGCKFYVNESTGEVTKEAPWNCLPEEMSLDSTNAPITLHSSAVDGAHSMSMSGAPGGRNSMLVNKLRTTVLSSNPKSLASAARASLAMSRMSSDSQTGPGGGTNLGLLEKLQQPKHPVRDQAPAPAEEAEEFILGEDAEGTGSVVYDRSEVTDFFKILDVAAASSSASASKKRAKTAPEHSPSRTWRDK